MTDLLFIIDTELMNTVLNARLHVHQDWHEPYQAISKN